MICEQSIQNKNTYQDEGELFEDEFDSYPYQEHVQTMKRQVGNLNHSENLALDPFEFEFIAKISTPFHRDEKKNQERAQVGTPKQLPLAFEINYNRPLPDLHFESDGESDDGNYHQNGANEDSTSGLQKIFNNTPGRIVFAIREEAHEIRFKQENVSDFVKMNVIKEIFVKLIEKVLMNMKGEDKRKTLVMMLFNKVDMDQMEKLKKRKNKTKAVENYLKIIEKYDEKDVNEAKALLRTGVFSMMNNDWIYHQALHIRFRRNEQNQRKARIVFEQYMKKFRNELYDGKIEAFVDREEVLGIPSAIEREGFEKGELLKLQPIT